MWLVELIGLILRIEQPKKEEEKPIMTVFYNVFALHFHCLCLQGMMTFSGITHSWRNSSSPFMLVFSLSCLHTMKILLHGDMEFTVTFPLFCRILVCKEPKLWGVVRTRAIRKIKVFCWLLFLFVLLNNISTYQI